MTNKALWMWLSVWVAALASSPAIKPEASMLATGVSAQHGVAQQTMFRGGPSHVGVSDTEGVERLGSIRWLFETGGAVRSSAALWGDTLYVGSSDRHLYAIDVATGQQVWRFAASAPIASSPAATDDRLFFGDRAGRIYALDRRTGSEVWSKSTGPDLELPAGPEGWDYITASPTVADSTLLMGSGDGILYALDPATGSERWVLATDARIRSTPAVTNGVVYFGNSQGLFFAVDLKSGAELWRFETDGHALTEEWAGFDRTQIFSSAAVADGVVYFGSRDAKDYALDAVTGDLLWAAGDGTSAWVISSPAIIDGVVYGARSSSNKVRALEAATGNEIWNVSTDGYFFSSPVVVEDTVYLGNSAGWMYAFDRRNGDTRWRYRTGGGIWATPLVADGSLYVGSDDGFVYAFEHTEGTQPKRAYFWDEELRPFTTFGRGDSHRGAADHFDRFGYEHLDAATIAEFMEARIRDTVPSVIVFAMNHLPEAVQGEPMATSIFRRYLDAGGKIVWPGTPPMLYVFNEQGTDVTALDPDSASEALGVDLRDYAAGSYPVSPTEEGRRWGLSGSWVGEGGFRAQDVDRALALDDTGMVAAWVKEFGGPAGTGFVLLQPVSDEGELDEVRAVAEYGVMRTPTRARD